MKIDKLNIKLVLGIIALMMLPAVNAFADSVVQQSFSWKEIIIGITGGLAFFLYGMEKMSNGNHCTRFLSACNLNSRKNGASLLSTSTLRAVPITTILRSMCMITSFPISLLVLSMNFR